ncbi:helicase-exonuclease AddAB subunit AddB [Staphylococcus sp. 17KM0847]|uniref:helicase-exonuclease AddAB subunit AddB n=1 Tax=Staphylococcus sp. 17KM0847 TaxID=2583989 RepID=UPI0015DC3D09|nr:helicase-exonuclease AddAB subunit AddB [Staphylococcus sp. 17KM0847]QLK85624.1 helicase-exonuclease AddAB subunit AddB [Staphylococcus sp. 17KM0847]
MFRTFIGRAGTGKSTAMMREIKEKIQAAPLGDPIVIITQAQGTYLYEQAFVNDPDLKGSLRAEVLHFERLSHRIFQEVGGVCETRLSLSATEMMTYDILQSVQSKLKLYKSQVKYLGFSTKIHEQIQDFEKYAVDAERVKAVSEDSRLQRRTRDKLHDIGLVYECLKERLGEEYITAEGLMNRFIHLIPHSDWLRRAEIYIDGFHSFSIQEYQIIEALVQQAKCVTVLLTTNGDHHELSMFRKTSESLKRIQDIAVNTQNTLDIHRFEHTHRFKSESLKAIESQFDALQPQSIQVEDQGVQILEAASMREEVTEVARHILEDVRQNHYRYNDIAILYRDPNYIYLLESILMQHDIPYNIDQKKSMIHHPIMEMFLSLIEVLRTNWQFEPMMRLLKTNILTQHFTDSRYLIDLLENYAIERGIYGERWFDKQYFQLEDFKKMGFKQHQKMSSDDVELFQRVIAMKEDVIGKLLMFEEQLSKGKHARDYATAFYKVMEAFELPNQLMTQRDILDTQGQYEQAEEIDQIWKGLIRILDETVAVFDEQPLSRTRFLEVLDVGLNTLEFSMIPQTLDQVTIGTMDFAKVENKCHVYLVGMNDGVMPRTMSGHHLISDDEKKDLEQYAGVSLSPTTDVLQMDEAFVCYCAMTRAQKHITLTYSLMDSAGAEKEPSPYIQEVQSILPMLSVLNIGQQNSADMVRLIAHPHQSKVHLFEALRAWLEGKVVADGWFELYRIMVQEDTLQSGMAHLTTSLEYTNDTTQLSQQLTYDLYGQTMNASVSRFERYNSCPFKHYVSHGLKLNERTKYQLQNFDLGTIFHDVLSYIAEKVEGRFNQLSPQQIQTLTQEALDIYLPQVQFNLLNATSYYRYLSRRIGEIVQATLKAMKHQTTYSQFHPIAFEKAFRKAPRSEDELYAMPLMTEQGIPINVRGQIDRIDLYEHNGKSFVNIIDYKSSNTSAKLDLVKVYYGLQMQMMTYMDVVLQNKSRLNLVGDVKPGGFLYMHVHKFKDKKRNWDKADKEDHQTTFLKSYQLQGLLNSDSDVIEAYDQRLEQGVGSDIVPIKLNKNGGFDSNSTVADEQTIYRLIERNKRNFVTTATHIMEGHTAVAPLKFKNTLPCQYCQYKSVCHVDSMIDTPKYRQVNEHIKPLEILKCEKDEEETR